MLIYWAALVVLVSAMLYGYFMNELSEGLSKTSSKLFEGSLARALDVVLSSEEGQRIPVLDRHTGETGPAAVLNSSPALGIMNELAEGLFENENAEKMASRYDNVTTEMIKGVALGLEIAGIALADYVTGLDELEERAHLE
jgi:hypothetical protein